ncbi:uncharacterized protein LOC106865507 [Brachypodium distachyon]|uniref:uncharacterized protein LOC106865507 n=1 Tax=Brachypodium distachyon TaxID=15368 RepID=UPI00071C5434|nr:uncharacterized protein LOC106865507 [Brachypodium distachyon]|eukprot:XP_014751134.1 uncharacterized protein LOC106865507 [Brachypodium distachyon]
MSDSTRFSNDSDREERYQFDSTPDPSPPVFTRVNIEDSDEEIEDHVPLRVTPSPGVRLKYAINSPRPGEVLPSRGKKVASKPKAEKKEKVKKFKDVPAPTVEEIFVFYSSEEDVEEETRMKRKHRLQHIIRKHSHMLAAEIWRRTKEAESANLYFLAPKLGNFKIARKEGGPHREEFNRRALQIIRDINYVDLSKKPKSKKTSDTEDSDVFPSEPAVELRGPARASRIRGSSLPPLAPRNKPSKDSKGKTKMPEKRKAAEDAEKQFQKDLKKARKASAVGPGSSSKDATAATAAAMASGEVPYPSQVVHIDPVPLAAFNEGTLPDSLMSHVEGLIVAKTQAEEWEQNRSLRVARRLEEDHAEKKRVEKEKKAEEKKRADLTALKKEKELVLKTQAELEKKKKKTMLAEQMKQVAESMKVDKTKSEARKKAAEKTPEVQGGNEEIDREKTEYETRREIGLKARHDTADPSDTEESQDLPQIVPSKKITMTRQASQIAEVKKTAKEFGLKIKMCWGTRAYLQQDAPVPTLKVRVNKVVKKKKIVAPSDPSDPSNPNSSSDEEKEEEKEEERDPAQSDDLMEIDRLPEDLLKPVPKKRRSGLAKDREDRRLSRMFVTSQTMFEDNRELLSPKPKMPISSDREKVYFKALKNTELRHIRLENGLKYKEERSAEDRRFGSFQQQDYYAQILLPRTHFAKMKYINDE